MDPVELHWARTQKQFSLLDLQSKICNVCLSIIQDAGKPFFCKQSKKYLQRIINEFDSSSKYSNFTERGYGIEKISWKLILSFHSLEYPTIMKVYMVK